LDGFAHVVGVDMLGSGEISDGAGDYQLRS